MREALNAAVDALLGRIFEVDPREISDGTRRGDLARWDSLGHLRMVAALREELGADVPPELALDMESVADVKRIVVALVPRATHDGRSSAGVA